MSDALAVIWVAGFFAWDNPWLLVPLLMLLACGTALAISWIVLWRRRRNRPVCWGGVKVLDYCQRTTSSLKITPAAGEDCRTVWLVEIEDGLEGACNEQARGRTPRQAMMILEEKLAEKIHRGDGP